MGSNHTGNLSPQLRNMTSVEKDKLMVNHTFPSKEILLIRIAEEANLSGINVSVKRSDDFRLEVVGSKQSQFEVVAACSSAKGWRVTACETRLQVPNTTTTDHATADAFKENKDDTDDDGNCNTFPVAMSIQFGNEDKLGWMQFWDFAKTLHPSLDDKDTTIITDQDKGLRAAVSEVLPSAAPFICSFHHEQNIMKYVKGGNGTYSCRWMFKKLLKAHTVAEIEHLKNKHAVHIDDKAWKYLGTVNDEEVYPAARCNLSRTSCMYQRSASSSAESMNHANLAARGRTAVDVVSSTMLLLKLSAARYSAQK
jgi:hypothetical protein